MRVDDLYEVEIHQDRYGGAYSHGKWFAAWMWAEGCVYAVIEDAIIAGPKADDVSAANFWHEPPRWIAVGDTPNEALENLKAKWTDEAIAEAKARKP
jgi:hypothetical protein